MKALGVLIALSVLTIPVRAFSGEPAECFDCHEGIDQKAYLQSSHGNLSCTGCHTLKEEGGLEHPEDLQGKVDCSTCHSEETEAYRSSVHSEMWEADPDSAPGCVSCHGTHQIQKSRADAFKQASLDLCSKCHADSARTYLDTYHGKVANLGYLEDMPLCWDCHGAHDILSVSDPRSPASPERVLATCLYCHPDANKNFAGYRVHGDKFSKKKDPISFWTYVVMFAIVCFAFGTWVPHTILWFLRDQIEAIKSRKSKSSSPGDSGGGS